MNANQEALGLLVGQATCIMLALAVTWLGGGDVWRFVAHLALCEACYLVGLALGGVRS